MLAHGVFGTGVPLIIAVLFVCPAVLIAIGTVAWINHLVTKRGLFGKGRGRQPRLAHDLAHDPMMGGSTANALATNIRPELAAPLDPYHGSPAANFSEIVAFDPTVTEPHGATPHPREVPTEAEAIPRSESESAGEPVRMDEPRPLPALTDPDFNARADQILADIGKRLKAAIRDSDRSAAARPAEVPQQIETADPQPASLRIVAAPTVANVARPKPKSIYESLETEMATSRPGFAAGAAKDQPAE
jgi:hypothetical protein